MAEPDVLVRREVRAGAIVLATIVPLTTGLAAWKTPHGWIPVAIILALVVPLCVWWFGSWRLACDDDAVTIGGFFRRRLRWRDVDRIVAGRLAHDPFVVIVCRSRWRAHVRIPFRQWGPALLRVLRSHAPPGTYRISLADEEALWGRGAPTRIGRRMRIRAAPTAAYRDPARPTVSISLDRSRVSTITAFAPASRERSRSLRSHWPGRWQGPAGASSRSRARWRLACPRPGRGRAVIG